MNDEVTIIHVAYLNLDGKDVEIIVKDHDDLNNPSFYIVTRDRSEELYKISIFENKYSGNLSDKEKDILNTFIESDYIEENSIIRKPIKVFDKIKGYWILMNWASINNPYKDRKFNELK